MKVRIILAVFLIMVMAVTGLSASIGTEIQAKGMPLDEFLTLVSERTGIQMVAVPEVADIKVDLAISANQTLEEILAELKSKYYLVGKFNAAKDAVVILRGSYNYDGIYAGKMAPAPGVQLAMREASLAPPSMSAPTSLQRYNPNVPFNTEEYKSLRDNNFQEALATPLSTFSIDVDTASYSNTRRFINTGNLPPADAVRTEELLNYFSYDYPQPVGEHPFSVSTEVNECPWNAGHKLVMLGIQGKNIKLENLPPSNLVFLIDVSGSMASPNKLPLLKTAFKLLVRQLRNEDTVAIVVYAGTTGLVLEPTSGGEKKKIIEKIDSLQAGGSTAGGEGLKLAYKVAKEKFATGGNNRIILATDGDFNVGPSSEGELTRMIEERRNDGIYLSVLGFGMGNIKDNKMEALADRGNGNYAYIDNALEAKKVMVTQMAGTLYTIAKDVKIQVEFNPAQVKSYRLIGYENRVMDNKDFNDDKKDAGDMGAGHSVTAIYEIIPAGSAEVKGSVDPLVFQQAKLLPSEDLMQVKIRYKKPSEDTSILMTTRISQESQSLAPSENLRFASAVIEYGMLLRNSEFKAQATYAQALAMARGAKGSDENGYRAEFIRLMEVSQLLAPR